MSKWVGGFIEFESEREAVSSKEEGELEAAAGADGGEQDSGATEPERIDWAPEMEEGFGSEEFGGSMEAGKPKELVEMGRISEGGP